ncbi:MAG: response regulator [Actinobacteria bacterium]|nr:response regulator [Actinomycetota bacterium]
METSNNASILIVDDNPSKLKAVKSIFDGMTLDVITATSGEAALKIILEVDFAVILLDVVMPDMDGYEIAEMVHSVERTENTPIIFITAYAIDEKDISKGYSLGVVDYITSPIQPEILRNKVAVFADLFSKRNQLRKIVENNAFGIVIVDGSGYTRFMNPAAEQLLDRKAVSMIGEPFSLPTGNKVEIEVHRRDGEPLVVEMRAVEIEWDGDFAQLVSLNDITDRKKDEIQLQKAKDELEESVDGKTYELSTLYHLIGSVGRTVRYEDVFHLGVSAIGEVMEYDLIGVLHARATGNEIIMTRAAPVADSVIKEAGEILMEKFIEAGGTVFVSDDYPFEVEDTFSKEKDLQVLEPMTFHRSTILDIGDKLMGVMIIVSTGENDFTEEQVRLFETIANEIGGATQRLDRIIESEERRIRTIINSISEGVLFINQDGTITLSNPAADSILEFYALRQDKEKDAVREVVEKALAHPGSHAEMEIETAHLDMLRAYHLEATTIWGADSDASGTAVVIRDITAEREAERLRSSFLSSISHDLRTPLTSVKEYIAILLDGYGGDLSEKQYDCLQTALRNAERLKALIEDLLTVTRMEAHGFTISKKDTPFSSITDVCIKSLMPRAKKKGINLECYSPGEVSVYVDQLRISQVLTNLIDNALKFTPEGGNVRVETRERNDHLLVSVSDNGRGISREEIPHIFDLFYKNSTGNEYEIEGGTGLGLFISSEMIEAHGGKIWVESTLGEGTTFFFKLPISSKKSGLKEFLSDALDRSVKYDLPLSVVVMNSRNADIDGELLKKVRQRLGPEDSVIMYGDGFQSMVIAMLKLTGEEHMKIDPERFVAGILGEKVNSKSLSFEKESRDLRVVFEEVLKNLLIDQKE